jgi:hypothetical protein
MFGARGKRGLTILAVAAPGAAFVIASGVTSATTAAPASRHVTPHAYVQVVNPTTSTQETGDEAISDTLPGLDKGLFEAVSLSPSPSDEGAEQLDVTLRGAPDVDGSLTSTLWQADLAQGAIADRMAGDQTNLADVVSDSGYVLSAPDGSFSNVGGGVGDVAAHQVFDAQASSVSDDAIINASNQTLSKFNVTPTTVRVIHPLGPALMVIGNVSSPDQLKDAFTRLSGALNGGGSEFEGWYLEIDGPKGEPLVRSSVAERAGIGRVWFAPGMDELMGIGH